MTGPIFGINPVNRVGLTIGVIGGVTSTTPTITKSLLFPVAS